MDRSWKEGCMRKWRAVLFANLTSKIRFQMLHVWSVNKNNGLSDISKLWQYLHLRTVELAVVMNRLYGDVCYAGIDTDPELKYPKGAGRVAFSKQQSYIAAISARFVQLQYADIDKRVCTTLYVRCSLRRREIWLLVFNVASICSILSEYVFRIFFQDNFLSNQYTPSAHCVQTNSNYPGVLYLHTYIMLFVYVISSDCCWLFSLLIF